VVVVVPVVVVGVSKNEILFMHLFCLNKYFAVSAVLTTVPTSVHLFQFPMQTESLTQICKSVLSLLNTDMQESASPHCSVFRHIPSSLTVPTLSLVSFGGSGNLHDFYLTIHVLVPSRILDYFPIEQLSTQMP
jgi:hypothetical protein